MCRLRYTAHLTTKCRNAMSIVIRIPVLYTGALGWRAYSGVPGDLVG